MDCPVNVTMNRYHCTMVHLMGHVFAMCTMKHTMVNHGWVHGVPHGWVHGVPHDLPNGYCRAPKFRGKLIRSWFRVERP